MTAELDRGSSLEEGPWLPPESSGVLAEPAVQQAVQTFLAVEAESLDDRRYDDWLAMVDDGFVYRVPVPVVHDTPFAPTYDPTALLIDETRESIVDTWFARFGPGVYDVAWGEHPPPRFRHLVTNVRVRETPTADRYVARSNVLLSIVRHATPPGQLYAERFDVVRRSPAGWRLASRYAVLHDVLLTAPQIRVIL